MAERVGAEELVPLPEGLEAQAELVLRAGHQVGARPAEPAELRDGVGLQQRGPPVQLADRRRVQRRQPARVPHPARRGRAEGPHGTGVGEVHHVHGRGGVPVEGDRQQALRGRHVRLQLGELLGGGEHRADRLEARFEFLGQPEVEVEPVRGPDPLLEELLDAPPGDPPHHFAGERADHGRVVPVRRPRLPERPLRCQPFGDHAVVGQLCEGEPALDPDQPCAVGEQLPQGQPVLSLGGELGPVRGHFTVEVEYTFLYQQCDDQVGRALDGGVDAGQRVAGDPVAHPEVHHPLPVQVGRELRAEFAGLLGGDGRELLPYALEARGDGSPHVHRVRHLCPL